MMGQRTVRDMGREVWDREVCCDMVSSLHPRPLHCELTAAVVGCITYTRSCTAGRGAHKRPPEMRSFGNSSFGNCWDMRAGRLQRSHSVAHAPVDGLITSMHIKDNTDCTQCTVKRRHKVRRGREKRRILGRVEDIIGVDMIETHIHV